MKIERLISAACFAILLASLYQPAAAQTVSPDVEAQLQEKTQRLQSLNQEIAATQSTLNEVQKQKNSLQKEVKTLDTSIKQLDLTIKQDDLQSQTLGLQINSLQGDLEAMGQAIDAKRATIVKLFRELQKNDDANLIATLLSHSSLADLLRDAESIESLRSQLSIDVAKLNEMSNQYREKMGLVSQKKTEVTLHLENIKNRKVIVQDQKVQRASILEETKNQESVYQQKISKLQAEQNALEDEISQMEEQLAKNFNSNVLPAKRSGVLSWPVASPRITQNFGQRSSLYRGKPHNGMDIGVSIGTPVFAAADGVVIASGNNDQSRTRKYQYGQHILIKHGNNLATLYAHLSQRLVSAGTTVKRGDLIGYSGNTGYSTGPHLHFGLYWAPTIELKSIPPAAGLVPVGVVLNPADYL